MSRFIPNRRAVLLGGGGIGLLIGIGAWRASAIAPTLAGTRDATGIYLHDWIHIGGDGQITLRTGLSEMGQGAFTGVATLVAEELGVRPNQLTVETGPAAYMFKNVAAGRDFVAPSHGLAQKLDHSFATSAVTFMVEKLTQQITGGSSSMRDRFLSARQAGALARILLINAAARQWSVAPQDCEAVDGQIRHLPTGKALSFGDIAPLATQEPLPQTVTLKPRAQWKLIGGRVDRVDIPAKINGSAVFGIDVRRKGMLFAAVLHSPVFGGKLKSHDAQKALAMSGVTKVVVLEGAIAVVAASTWQAKRALPALAAVWDAGDNGALSTPEIAQRLADSLQNPENILSKGDFAGAQSRAAKTLVSEYHLPYLAHATMEPMNCTVEISDGYVDVWVPTQAQTVTQQAAASAAGVSTSKVRVHTTYLGGGFGRRLKADFVTQAVKIAVAVGRPVQVLWSREEDMQHDFYRPMVLMRLQGGLDAAGVPSALRIAIANQSITGHMYHLKNDESQFQGAAHLDYDIANQRTDLGTISVNVPVGYWRSVGHSFTAFGVESFIDEMANAAGTDPLAFRLSILQHAPRLVALLQLVTQKAGWGTPLPKGEGRGLALHTSFGSAVAEVVEVAVTGNGALKVKRVTAAVDCGTAINPDIVRAQVESAVI
ncbi:MAG: xanthine dehydrogenase family protein molybdopterin-binding subunit, partial [Hyphomicrobiales bacterium]|nr:xanthine dehydrogenase family protein molybdopterin-binding subunit [Hyphomicrobiales bacterium]